MGGGRDPETGAWSGPRYMPIGGQYLMERNDTSTKLSSSFCGTLDGQGHYILNIYCPHHCDGSYGDGQSIGLSGRLGVHDSDPAELRPDSPAVRNLAVTGYIEGNRSVGGIAGKIGRSQKGAVVENCANYTTVKNTDAKGCGGIVGAGWNLGTIRNCFNAGDIMTTYVCPTGGISGSNELPIENCYNVGTISAIQDSFAMGIGTNNGGGNRVDNCFWLAGSAPGGGYYGKNNGAVTELSEADMRAAAPKLGAAFLADTGVNGGDVPFADVSAPSVTWAYRNGVVNGMDEHTFAPDASITREQIAAMLKRYTDISRPTGTRGDLSVFTDRALISGWAADSLSWAVGEGLVNGRGTAP